MKYKRYPLVLLLIAALFWQNCFITDKGGETMSIIKTGLHVLSVVGTMADTVLTLLDVMGV